MPSLTKIQTGFLEPQGAFELDPGTASAPGLKFSTSAATGMFSPSTGVLGFSTGSTQNALRILSDGKVGIGLTNPSNKLHVSGNARIDGNTNPYLVLNDGTNTGYFQIASGLLDLNHNGDITFSPGGSQKVRITSTGNVGIGTTNPSQLLVVQGITLINTNTSSSFGTLQVNGDIGLQGTRTIRCASNSDSESLTILATRLSIGSSNSNAYSYADGGLISSTTNGDGSILFDAGRYSTASRFRVQNTSSDNVQISLYSPSGTTFIATTGGNVGIGTTNPSAKLQVQGDAIITSSLSINGVPYTSSISYEPTSYFTIQQHLENNNLTCFNTLTGTLPTYVTDNNTTTPYSKAALFSNHWEGPSGDYIPVTPGETIYGEIWAKRNTGATGTAGIFYVGIARYDKDKNPIAVNQALVYFVANAVTIPTDSTWTKYSGTTTLPTSHTPYNGSDGGPVRYIRPYIIVNYTAGTIPTYVTGFSIKKQGVFGSENVGIGTNNPSAKLDVRGWTNITSASVDPSWNSQLLITGNATYQPKITLSSNNGYRWSIRNDDPVGNGELKFRYEEGSLEALTITRTGNVGIGTTNPGAKLHVSTGASSTIATFQGAAGRVLYTGTDGVGHYIEVQGTQASERVLRLQAFDGGSGYAQLFIDGANKYLYTSSNMNVGVGTANPQAKLHVEGGILSRNFSNVTGNSGLMIGSSIAEGTYSTLGSSIYTFCENSGTNAYAMQLFTQQSYLTGQTEKVRITGSGNVGIGLTNPANKLVVSGGITNTSDCYFTSGVQGSPGYIYLHNGGADATDTYLRAGSSTGVWSAVRITGNWNGSENTGGAVRLYTAGQERLTVNSAGVTACAGGVMAPMGWVYTNTYTANSTWNTAWQTIIPTGICSYGTYVVSMFWDYASAPSAGLPYYITASTIFTAVPSTNGTGNENAVVLLSATHTGGTGATIQVRTIAFNSGNTGLQVNILNYSPVSGTQFTVYVQKIGY